LSLTHKRSAQPLQEHDEKRPGPGGQKRMVEHGELQHEHGDRLDDQHRHLHHQLRHHDLEHRQSCGELNIVDRRERLFINDITRRQTPLD